MDSGMDRAEAATRATEVSFAPVAGTSAGAPIQGWRIYQAIRFMLRGLRWWVRLEVKGLDNLPLRGPALVVANHDSWLDPLVIIEAMAWRRRLLRFLAKSSLWKSPILAWILDGTVQIPVDRGANDTAAMESAVNAIERGETIGIFPEGTLSRGKKLRAKRGVARLAQASPGVPVVLVAVTGSTVLKKFPERPQVTVEFFLPSGGQPRDGEDQAELSQRLLDDIRDRAPQVF